MTLIIFPLTGHLDSVLTVKLLITIITKGHWGGFPGSSVSKKFTCSAGDQGLIPVSVRTPGKGNGNPLQDFCLETPIDRGAWWAAVHGVAKSGTQLSDFTFTFHFHALEKEMATHSSVLAWKIPRMGSLVGCRLWGRTELDTTEAT